MKKRKKSKVIKPSSDEEGESYTYIFNIAVKTCMA